MRLILEEEDLLQILEAHLGEKLDRGRVQVRAEPFEVELVGLRMEAPAPATNSKPVLAPRPLAVPRPVETPTAASEPERRLSGGATFEMPPIDVEEETSGGPVPAASLSME